MSLLKACGKLLGRSISNLFYRNDKEAARKTAYSETGKAINRAKKNGYRINGSKTYQKKYNACLEQASERKRLRDKFIDEL